MPALSQTAFSVDLIARDALEMSVSPRQNFSKPPPVPEKPTVTFAPSLFFTLFDAFSKYFAATADSGYTVLDPSMRTVSLFALAMMY